MSMRTRALKIATFFAVIITVWWKIYVATRIVTTQETQESLTLSMLEELHEFSVASKKNPYIKCRPTKQFVYIKTHKTGSTTLYRLLKKYVKKHGIVTAAKFPDGPFLGGYPGPLDIRFVYTDRKGSVASIADLNTRTIMDHFRFSHSLKNFLPLDIPYFSIMRDPWHHFQSAYYYHYGDLPGRLGSGINCFRFPFYQAAEGKETSGPVEYLLKAEQNLNSSVPWFFRSRNYQSFDLGIDPLLDDDLGIKNALAQLSLDLDLVLITDYYEHSLILLKKLLCLDWADLMYGDDGSYHQYASIDIKNYPGANSIFKRLYKQDIALYKHFNNTLWRKVDEYGRERMENDLKTLRAKRKQFLQSAETEQKKKTKRSVKNVDIFRLAQSRLGKKAEMEALLVNKLRNFHDMDAASASSTALYMAKHGGLCPL